MSQSAAGLVRALVADDEPIARAALVELLGAHAWLTVVSQAASGAEAVRDAERLRPELMFLDIHMPEGNGLDVLKSLSYKPAVVFTTAYAQHAVDAFELGAVDYLLKPFGSERLGKTLERVKSSLGTAEQTTVDRLAEAMRQGFAERLFVRSGLAIIPLSVEAISRVESWGDYVRLYAGSTRYVMHIALARLEERLDPARFARVHRTAIVNLGHVRAFKTAAKGRVVAELRDGSTVPVSRTKAQTLRRLGQ